METRKNFEKTAKYNVEFDILYWYFKIQIEVHRNSLSVYLSANTCYKTCTKTSYQSRFKFVLEDLLFTIKSFRDWSFV